MGITFLLWNGALENTNRPARVGNLVYLGPFISLLWISLILEEIIRPATVAGLAVVIAGILIGQSRKKS
jgi:drug/metabolite transporter (DMT)-like permease